MRRISLPLTLVAVLAALMVLPTGVAAQPTTSAKPATFTTLPITVGANQGVIGGANDYRFFVESEQRFDGSAAAYVSHDGGATWTNEFMPGISEENGGTYQGIGDPAFARTPATRPLPAPWS